MTFPLEVEGLCLELGGRSVASGLSFAVAVGERAVLLGVNGCGKTTLLKALAGLLSPTLGRISYDGVVLDSRRLNDPAFRRRFRGEVALLFQNVDAMLFNPTVADEIAFGPRQLGLPDVDGRVARWSQLLDLEPLLERAPFELSGGEKKRVALGAVLAVDPKLLLLDEPTGGLDPAWAARVVDLLSELRGATVIVSTHNLSIVEELGPRAMLMAPGRSGLLYDGSSTALVTNDALLVESGLAHRHHHRHGAAEHAHFHVHETD
jgi:cobalt/nickel transport system ATP-binding protein